MKSHREQERGFALVLTILVISLLAGLTLRFNIAMRSDLYASATACDSIRAGYIAKSGFNYALAVLAEDTGKNDFDSISEAWNDKAALSGMSASMFQNGLFELEIIDHSGRININQLVGPDERRNKEQMAILKGFLGSKQFGLWPGDVDEITDAIKDWLDPDDDGRAEGAYYKALKRPHTCRNGPIMSIEELRLVRGVTMELFYGTKENPGISSYLTAYGNGKININTADPLILKALMNGAGQDLIEDMIAYRAGHKNNLKNPNWYKKLPGSEGIITTPGAVTTSSTFFEIYSKGFMGAAQKQARGIVKRGHAGLQIISWKID